jgi:hypothetical protein
MTLPNHWMTAEGSGTVVFPFLSLQGVLIPSKPTFEREVRPGVDGIGVWLTGNRGEPFSITTTLDCVDVAAAGTAYAAYGAAIPSKKDLYYAGAFWGTVMIQNVVLQSVKKLVGSVGGIQGGGATALLTVQWTIETLDQ